MDEFGFYGIFRTVILAVFIYYGKGQILDEPIENVTSCYNETLPVACSERLGRVFVTEVLVGVKNISHVDGANCSENSFDRTAKECCTRGSTDCVGNYEADSPDLQYSYHSSCIGKHQCGELMADNMLSSNVQCGAEYPATTDYMEIQYYCVNVSNMVQLDEGSKTNHGQGHMLYIWSGDNSMYEVLSSKTEVCSVETDCGETIEVVALDMRLESRSGICKQLTIDDGEYSEMFDCSSFDNYTISNLYSSTTSYFTLNVNNSGELGGYLWLGFKATSNRNLIINCQTPTRTIDCPTITSKEVTFVSTVSKVTSTEPSITELITNKSTATGQNKNESTLTEQETTIKQQVDTGHSTNQPLSTSHSTNQPTRISQTTNEPTNTAQTTNEPPATNQTTNESPATSQTTNEPTATSQHKNEPTGTAQASNEPTKATQTTNEPTKTAQTTNEQTKTAQTTNEPPATRQTTNEPTRTSQTTNYTAPTSQPTNDTVLTGQPTNDTAPTGQPTNDTALTGQPTNDTAPIGQLTNETAPTDQPTNDTAPTDQPTKAPTGQPTNDTAATSQTTNDTKSYVGLICGILAFLLVIAVILVIGIFYWKKRQREKKEVEQPKDVENGIPPTSTTKPNLVKPKAVVLPMIHKEQETKTKKKKKKHKQTDDETRTDENKEEKKKKKKQRREDNEDNGNEKKKKKKHRKRSEETNISENGKHKNDAEANSILSLLLNDNKVHPDTEKCMNGNHLPPVLGTNEVVFGQKEEKKKKKKKKKKHKKHEEEAIISENGNDADASSTGSLLRHDNKVHPEAEGCMDGFDLPPVLATTGAVSDQKEQKKEEVEDENKQEFNC